MIEFIENEDFCRWNGILMDDDKCQEIFGIHYGIDLHNDLIIVNGTIYSNLSLGNILRLLGQVKPKIEEYDIIASNGFGFEAHLKDKETENSVILNLYLVDELENIKSLDDIFTDYPKLNLDLYKQFHNEISEYYDKIIKYK